MAGIGGAQIAKKKASCFSKRNTIFDFFLPQFPRK
jgi:hypothetical protein